jgi:hypothetical protein
MVRDALRKMAEHPDWATSDKVSTAERELLARIFVEDSDDG